MTVTELTNNTKACNSCNCYSESAYKVTIHNTTILLCKACKHELTVELLSN